MSRMVEIVGEMRKLLDEIEMLQGSTSEKTEERVIHLEDDESASYLTGLGGKGKKLRSKLPKTKK